MELISIENISDAMHLTWIINNICTKKCDYCPPSLHNGSNHHYDWNQAKAFIDVVMKRYNKIHVTISGGEPTVSPFLIDLVKTFYESGQSVGITSNGARSVRYFKELAPMLSFLCLSWHPSSIDADFIDKAQASAQGCLTKVRIMMDARHWNTALDFIKEIKNYPDIQWEAVRVTPWHSGSWGRDSYTYTDEQEQWFNTAQSYLEVKHKNEIRHQLISNAHYSDGTSIKCVDPTRVINQQQNSFVGWACHQGLESLFVQYTGEVGAANCSQNRDLGWIQKLDEIKWPNIPVTCRTPVCDCTSDILLTKYKHMPREKSTTQKFLSWINHLPS